MTNRKSLLGRSRPADRLSKSDREALERAAAEPAPESPPAKASPAKNTAPPANAGKEASVRKSQLKFHWTAECPACGFKVAGGGNPQPGQRLARCGRCKLNIYLKGK
ncbi:MAG: hypothetical protein TQ37_03945 [Candidatus Synechococcus spongiarum 15L]|uniref:Uncharacterized protein n=1 Tax=Candidatus Synechococcus spongiarum 15L TaxID=1608419 RepID=A0A0G8AX99_9SYNE|nr:MAG: hypothetical protein TQ37_03945 [Candidatus Synechococcus spongiarum 15L]